MIDKIDRTNYARFRDMLQWRATGDASTKATTPPSGRILQDLDDPNLYVYAYEADGKYVGWISLVYIPKVSRCHGHLYVDELWTAPEYRRRGIATALMQQADIVAKELDASGLRLYVNTENPGAKALYEKMGYAADGTAHWMSKE